MFAIITTAYQLLRGTEAEAARAAFDSGFVDQALSILAAFPQRADHLAQTNRSVLYAALGTLTRCREHPKIEEKIRGVASALAFCLENDLDVIEALGATIGTTAAAVCERTP